jgi:PAS domain-containing protein
MTNSEPNNEKMARRSVRSLDDPETLKLLIRSIGEGIYITDSDGRFLDANAAFLEIFGVPSLEDLQRFEVPQLLADPAVANRRWRFLASEGSVREFELVIVSPMDSAVRYSIPRTRSAIPTRVKCTITVS